MRAHQAARAALSFQGRVKSRFFQSGLLPGSQFHRTNTLAHSVELVSADNSSAVAVLRARRSEQSCSQNEGVNTREVIHGRYHKPPLGGGKLR